MRVGRYWITNYDQRLVDRMKSLYRHVYSVGEWQGHTVVYDFDHNPLPEKIMITDMMIALTSSRDRMTWEVLMRDMNFIKDRTITF